MIEKVYKPARKPAWWFVSGSAFHQATERYDHKAWERGLPDVADKSINLMHDLLVEEFEKEIAEAEQDEPDRTQWMRGGRASKAFPEKEAEAFYRAQFPDWAAAFDHYSRTSGRTIYTLPDGAPAIELNFTAEFGGVMVRGAIDRLIVEQGMLGILDYKSGASAGDPVQNNLYRAAIERLGWDEIPTFGAFWNPRKGTEQQPAFALDMPASFFDRQFRAADAQRRSGQIVFNVNKDCVRCGVRDFCPAVSTGPQVITEIL